jgi:hypothetical protein
MGLEAFVIVEVDWDVAAVKDMLLVILCMEVLGMDVEVARGMEMNSKVLILYMPDWYIVEDGIGCGSDYVRGKCNGFSCGPTNTLYDGSGTMYGDGYGDGTGTGHWSVDNE